MVFRDQVLVFARPGLVPATALDDLLDQVKALDMDDVRKRIADDEAADAAAQAVAGGQDGEGSPPKTGHEDR
jgi:thioredoxin 1